MSVLAFTASTLIPASGSCWYSGIVILVENEVMNSAVRLHLIVYHGQLHRSIPDRQKSSPFMPHGLHSLFACLRAINPAVVFFLSHFLQSTLLSQCCFYKTTVSIHPQAKKKSGTLTATTVLHLRQKKTTQSYIYIMLSYVCFL